MSADGRAWPAWPIPIKLSSNEIALGPSPLAVAAYEEAAKGLAIYPEGSARMLREAIGAPMGWTPRASSAATARTSCSPCSPTPICAPATK